MTANQISYANFLEKQRSDRETERLRGEELAESKRATNIHKELTQESINAGILNTETSAAASRYGANQAAGASIYGSNTQYKINEANIAAQVGMRESQTALNYSNVTRNTVENRATTVNTLFNAIDKGASAINKVLGWVPKLWAS